MSKRGFTLVEMLVVVAIIVVLAGIIIPAMQSATCVGGKRGLCMSHMHTLDTAITMYVETYKQYPFQGVDRKANPVDDLTLGPKAQGLLYNEFSTDKMAYGCPSTNSNPAKNITAAANGVSGMHYPCQTAYSYDFHHSSDNEGGAVLMADEPSLMAKGNLNAATEHDELNKMHIIVLRINHMVSAVNSRKCNPDPRDDIYLQDYNTGLANGKAGSYTYLNEYSDLK